MPIRCSLQAERNFLPYLGKAGEKADTEQHRGQSIGKRLTPSDQLPQGRPDDNNERQRVPRSNREDQEQQRVTGSNNEEGRGTRTLGERSPQEHQSDGSQEGSQPRKPAPKCPRSSLLLQSRLSLGRRLGRPPRRAVGPPCLGSTRSPLPCGKICGPWRMKFGVAWSGTATRHLRGFLRDNAPRFLAISRSSHSGRFRASESWSSRSTAPFHSLPTSGVRLFRSSQRPLRYAANSRIDSSRLSVSIRLVGRTR